MYKNTLLSAPQLTNTTSQQLKKQHGFPNSQTHKLENLCTTIVSAVSDNNE